MSVPRSVCVCDDCRAVACVLSLLSSTPALHVSSNLSSNSSNIFVSRHVSFWYISFGLRGRLLLSINVPDARECFTFIVSILLRYNDTMKVITQNIEAYLGLD